METPGLICALSTTTELMLPGPLGAIGLGAKLHSLACVQRGTDLPVQSLTVVTIIIIITYYNCIT